MSYEPNSQQPSRNQSDPTEPPGGRTYPPMVMGLYGLQRLQSGYSDEIIQALSELRSEEVISTVGIGPTLEDKSDEVISGLGFSVVEAEKLSPGLESLKDFSLIGSTNIDETIQNSKIIDPDLDKLTPNKTKAIDKFKSESDPIYDLDEERTDSIKKLTLDEMRQARKSRVSLAKKLSQRVKKSHNKMMHKNRRRFRRKPTL